MKTSFRGSGKLGVRYAQGRGSILRSWHKAKGRKSTICVCQVGLESVHVNAEGLRGTKAVRAFKEGEAVAVLPYSRALHVGPKEWTSAVRSTQIFRQYAHLHIAG